MDSDRIDVSYAAGVGCLASVMLIVITAIALWFFLGPPSWPDHSTWMG